MMEDDMMGDDSKEEDSTPTAGKKPGMTGKMSVGCNECGTQWACVPTNNGFMPRDFVCPECGSSNCFPV